MNNQPRPTYTTAAECCSEQMELSLALTKLSSVRRALENAVRDPGLLSEPARSMAAKLLEAAETRCAELDAKLLQAQDVLQSYLDKGPQTFFTSTDFTSPEDDNHA